MNRILKHDRLEFVTLEDIYELQFPMNYVVFNFSLSEEERFSEFRRIMKKACKRRFTPRQIERLKEFKTPSSAGEFVYAVRDIIFKK